MSHKVRQMETSFGEDRPDVALVPEDINVTTAVACEQFSVDDTGRHSFTSVIDALTAPRYPASSPTFFVVFNLVSRQKLGILRDCRIDVLTPAGEMLVSQVLQDMRFQADQTTHRAVAGFPGITWPASGEYSVRLTSAGRKLSQFSVLLNISEPRGTQQ